MTRFLDKSSCTIAYPPKCVARKRILVAGMGTSPAVLTNAVWALTHQKKPVVPDEIVVLITKNGTIGAIRGAVAGAYYGVPADIRVKVEGFLDPFLIETLHKFEQKFGA